MTEPFSFPVPIEVDAAVFPSLNDHATETGVLKLAVDKEGGATARLDRVNTVFGYHIFLLPPAETMADLREVEMGERVYGEGRGPEMKGESGYGEDEGRERKGIREEKINEWS